MTIKDAGNKVNLGSTVMNHYTKYMVDPQHKIPIRATTSNRTSTNIYIQAQIEELIDYVDEDHLTVREAAKKNSIWVNLLLIVTTTGTRVIPKIKYRLQIEVLPPKAKATSDQVKNLIRYIVDDKMSVKKKVAIKAGLKYDSGNSYYVMYLGDPKHEVPVPGKPKYSLHRRCNQSEVNALIGYIVNDNMNAADVDEQAKRLVGYVNDDNMSIKAASEKPNIPYTASIKLYNECKDGVKNRPRNKIDQYNENLKVIAEIYKMYPKME